MNYDFPFNQNAIADKKTADNGSVYKFGEEDILFVVCEENVCADNGHLLVPVLVEFEFGNNVKTERKIQYCVSCDQFQMSLNDFKEMQEKFGVPNTLTVFDMQIEDDCDEFTEEEKEAFVDSYVIDYIVSHVLYFSDERRQRILKNAICSEEATKEEVLSFLQAMMKNNVEVSHEKLEKDYQYVCTL